MFPLRSLRFVLCSLDLDYYSFIFIFIIIIFFLGGGKEFSNLVCSFPGTVSKGAIPWQRTWSLLLSSLQLLSVKLYRHVWSLGRKCRSHQLDHVSGLEARARGRSPDWRAPQGNDR